MSEDSRLNAIDLARGIAMLGVALVNINVFAVGWTGYLSLDLATRSLDAAAEYFVGLVFAHRSYPVLAFLFGAGLAWQWERMPDALRQAKAMRPRLWALLLLGLVLGLLFWPGEVLSTYAIVGLVITRKLVGGDPRSCLVIAGTLLALGTFPDLLYAAVASPGVQRPWEHDLQSSSFALTNASAAMLARVVEWLSQALAQLFVLNVWAFILLGVWAARTGHLIRFLAEPLRARHVISAGLSCMLIGIVVETLAAQHGGWNVREATLHGHSWMRAISNVASLGGLWLWLTTAALWGARGDDSIGLKSLVIATGRAPLTQFFGQSIVFAIVFNKSLIGWHGELGRFAYSMIAISTYILLSGFIRAWLTSGHAHGPMETLWRSLTRLFSPQRLEKSPSESLPS